MRDSALPISKTIACVVFIAERELAKVFEISIARL